jgi:FtsP/CotA-like multicopper oxidase with cupredoxin domain
MVRIGPMASPPATLDRRALLAGLGAMALGSTLSTNRALGSQTRLLAAETGSLVLRPGGADARPWSIAGPPLNFAQRDTPGLEFRNSLPVAAVLSWRGIDGVPTIEPLLAQRPLAAGGAANFELPLRHAGTFFCDLALLGDGHAKPSRGLPLIVQESRPVSVDRDEVLLIEEWRVRPDGTAIAPGIEPKDAVPVHTVNGRTSFEISVRINERVRLRFISACQRSVIATKIDNYEVRVMAIDGQPSEPFQARNGALVLAPGGRTDVFIDVTMPAGTSTPILLHDGKEARPIGKIIVSSEPPIRPAPLPPASPLPSNGLPERIELKGANRVDLALGGAQGDWMAPANFAASAAPAFRTKRGRTVVLALTNRAAIATVFHLHGHHFRLLDKLDDGWKPFWLDTLAVEPGQTHRIAFLAEHAGRYLIESAATDWAAPRLVRWYAVE